MFIKIYDAITTTEIKTHFIDRKYVLVEVSKNNTDDIYVALSYNNIGIRETDWLRLSYNEKRFFGAPARKRITYVWLKSESGIQSVKIIARDAPISLPISKEDNVSISQTWTNPTSNPTLVLDVGNRRNVEVYAKSIIASKTVYVYGSIDNTNWRLCDTLTTSASSPYEYHKGYNNAYRFIKLELVETGTGSPILEISAS